MATTARISAKLQGIIDASTNLALAKFGPAKDYNISSVTYAVYTESANGTPDYAIDSSGVITRDGAAITTPLPSAGQTLHKIIALMVYAEKVNSNSVVDVTICQTAGNTVWVSDATSGPKIEEGGFLLWCVSEAGVDCSPTTFEFLITNVANGALVHICFIGKAA